jgi:hypothetical protein
VPGSAHRRPAGALFYRACERASALPGHQPYCPATSDIPETWHECVLSGAAGPRVALERDQGWYLIKHWGLGLWGDAGVERQTQVRALNCVVESFLYR